MNVNEQRPKYRWSGFNPRNLAIVIIIAGILIPYYTITHKSGDSTPPPAVPAEPLQLGKLQTHTYYDLGFAVSYPSDWQEHQPSFYDPEEPSLSILSKEICSNKRLMMTFTVPDILYPYDYQALVDGIASVFLELSESSLVEKRSVIYNGVSFSQVVLSQGVNDEHELWSVCIPLMSDDEAMFSLIVARCIPECWEYYKNAVYKIASTYQFLD